MRFDDLSLRTLPALLQRNASEDPERPFVLHAGGSTSRGEAWDRARRVATGLITLGLDKGDRMAIMLDNGPNFLDVWFGAATAGIVEVPLNPEMGSERLFHAMSNCMAKVVVVEAKYAHLFEGLHEQLPFVETLVLVGGSTDDSHFKTVPLSDIVSADIAELPDVRPDDTSAIMYTSGSTGLAKGVILPHAQHYLNGWQATHRAGLTADDRIIVVLPLHHNQAQGYAVMAAIVSGAQVYITPGFSRATFWREVNEAQATVLVFVGSLLALLGSQEDSPENTLRIAYGAMVPKQLYLELEARFGMSIVDAYGSTEAGIAVWGSADPAARVVGACGKVAPEYEVTIRGPHDEELPTEQIGEICIRGREPYMMFQGYFADPERTQEALRNFWFHSGDRGRFDEDGFLWFEGRVDDAIRRFGEFVSAKEVEDVVLAAGDVEMVAVYGIPDTVAGQEVMAAVVSRQGHSLDPEQVRARCVDHLPRFAVPRYVEVFDQLPVTPTGKVEKHKLRARGVGIETSDARNHTERKH